MSDLAMAVTAAAEAMRRRSTHTVETRAEVLSADAVQRLQTLEMQMGQLIAAYNHLQEQYRTLHGALSSHTHETIRSVA